MLTARQLHRTLDGFLGRLPLVLLQQMSLFLSSQEQLLTLRLVCEYFSSWQVQTTCFDVHEHHTKMEHVLVHAKITQIKTKCSVDFLQRNARHLEVLNVATNDLNDYLQNHVGEFLVLRQIVVWSS